MHSSPAEIANEPVVAGVGCVERRDGEIEDVTQISSPSVGVFGESRNLVQPSLVVGNLIGAHDEKIDVASGSRLTSCGGPASRWRRAQPPGWSPGVCELRILPHTPGQTVENGWDRITTVDSVCSHMTVTSVTGPP
jgi:hypothetical protein